MSINMTQSLTFETDDLKSFGLMLETSATVLFDSKSHKPFIRLKEPSFWGDGKYENYRDEQPDMLPLEDEVLLVSPCATYHGAKQLKVEGRFPNREKAAKKSCSLRKEPVASRQWICSIENYHDRMYPPKKGEIARPSKSTLINTVIELCKQEDSKKFLENFSTSECDYFDGDIGVAYRMDWRPNGGWNILDISMVHAYYGK